MQADPADLDPRVKLFELSGQEQPSWNGDAAGWAPVFDTFAFDIQDRTDQAQQFVGDLRSETLHG